MMFDAELDAFRRLLEDRRAELLRTLERGRRESEAERIGRYAGEVHDRGEESMIDAQAEVNSMLVEHHDAALAAVEYALRRMDQGNFGECASCAEPIAVERLRANPTATRCLSCQSGLEGDRKGA